MELIFKPYRDLYGAIAGRSSRTQFWIFSIYALGAMVIIYSLVIGIIGANIFAASHGQINPAAIMSSVGLIFLIMIPLTPWLYLTALAQLALACRRMHDQDRSAWYLLIGLIPFLGYLVLLIFMFLPGTAGANRYGPDPRVSETTTDVFS